MSLTKKIHVHKIKELQSNFIPKHPNHNHSYKNYFDDKKESSVSFIKQANPIMKTTINSNSPSIPYKKNISNYQCRQIPNNTIANNNNITNTKIITSNLNNSYVDPKANTDLLNNNISSISSNSPSRNNNIKNNTNAQIINNIVVPNQTTQIPSDSFISNTSNTSNVKVLCRFRPLNAQEKSITKNLSIASIDEDQVEIKSKNEYGNFTFHFDKIFPMNSTQKEIYDYAAKDLVDSVLAGYNSTIFAYGQTASGKTYTMQGILDSPEQEGIIPRMIRHIFHNIMISDTDIEFIVKISILEIYMEKIRDLIDLKKTNLNIREKDKEIYVEDLTEYSVSNEEEVMKFIKIGCENRICSTTNMNENSSRSHTIVVLTIHQKNIKTLEAKTGKLYLVDLAGSEKISKTGSSGLTLEEAKIINKSLSTLGLVINTLTDGKSKHVPYRESKLTRILTESLGGNAKTCLIITCSPSEYNESETLSTLRFGNRAKKVKNKPKINKEVTVQELKLKIEKLEKIVLICNGKINYLEGFIKANGLSVPDMDNINNNNDVNTNDNNDSLINKPLNNNSGLIGKEMTEIVNKYNNPFTKINLFSNDKDADLLSKIEEANIKIADLQSIIEQKEKIEEEHEEKERKLNDIISKISQETQNKITKDFVKKDLKIIDKSTLDELYTQLKLFILNNNSLTISKNPRLTKEINNKILSTLSSVIESNFAKNYYENDEKNKLNSRLMNQTVEKFEFLSNGTLLDYKDINENKVINNITNEALIKTINEKNDKIIRLESDVKEYKEKLELFEKQLTPDERNLHKKIYTLEKNLEQVNAMYHQVVTQKSVLKIENQLFEKKLKKRNEKIGTLVKENYGLIEQCKMKDEKIAYFQKNKSIAIPQVVKVIRGTGKNNNGNGNNDYRSMGEGDGEGNIGNLENEGWD